MLRSRNKKLSWYYAVCFTAFWIILYVAIVVQQVNHLPTPLTYKDAATHTDEFIAERAEHFLLKLSNLGPKVLGSEANEVKAVQLIMDEISAIQKQKSDYFDIEVDKQVVSGQYSATRLYQGVQNVIVKLSAKTSTSSNYLLINAHFDSVPTSPGASDDGAMVAVMLEALRVLAISKGPLEHPIVFLFNGAEEDGLFGSHGFVSQHKWAKNCKVVINLDAAGSGGRELLFRSAANSPWLINYYSRVPHPFANVVAEELFQYNLIPSDTDFRVFRNYAGMQGLDLAYVYNGYVYHTEFDSFTVFPKASLQNTGDNVLSLAQAIGNAPEMRKAMSNNDQPEYLIFYDFLGWFMLYYTLQTSIIINVVVCAAALIAITISLYFMSKKSHLSWLPFMIHCLLTLIIQIISVALAVGIPLFIAYFMDVIGSSMSWFSENWLICGLYFCPAFFALGILPAVFLECTKKQLLGLNFRIQLFMHSHCLLLIILTIALTCLGIRSAYMFMLPVLFYAGALIINLLTQLHNINHWFAIPIVISQIMPFIYITYVAEYLYFILIPVTGRSGSSSNPDLLISLVAIIMSVLSSGFLIPLYFLFRKTRTIISCFLAVTVIFIILASTPIGAPYTAQLAPQRYSIQHTNHVQHKLDGSMGFNESAIYLYQQDRHIDSAEDVINRFEAIYETSVVCNDPTTCRQNRPSVFYSPRSMWLPVNQAPIVPSEKPVLTITSSSLLDGTQTRRYNYTLSGPDHMSIIIEPKASAKIVNWSFDKALLTRPRKNYAIIFSYGVDSKAFEFFVDLENTTNNGTTGNLEIGIAGNWIHQTIQRAKIYDEFLKSFPDYVTFQSWIASYETWLF
uniref:FXNA-like protease n=1 Tax=Zeugodacus cucurbitae TaxID=28588 RepID=A0A0A1WZ70_ZEUCU